MGTKIGKWYEDNIEYLFHQSMLSSRRDPKISGYTPDFCITQPDGREVIVECHARWNEREKCYTSQRERAEELERIAKRNVSVFSGKASPDGNCLSNYELDSALMDLERAKQMKAGSFHSCGGDIRELFSKPYDDLSDKAIKYRAIAEGKRAYVIALYHDACLAGDMTAFDLTFSARVPYIEWTYKGDNLNEEVPLGSGWKDVWSDTEQEGIFYKYRYVSGLLYSTWQRTHHFLPNPFAEISVTPDLFPFAIVPDAPLLRGEPAWIARSATLPDNYLRPPNTWWGQVDRLQHVLKREGSAKLPPESSLA